MACVFLGKREMGELGRTKAIPDQGGVSKKNTRHAHTKNTTGCAALRTCYFMCKLVAGNAFSINGDTFSGLF